LTSLTGVGRLFEGFVMGNFYDGWLQLADQWREQAAGAKKYILKRNSSG
jgi:hypothetical protein